MIEINFFEKKQVNVLPYVLAGVFFILLAFMGTYFYLRHTHYVELEQNNSEWIQNNVEEVSLSRKIEQLDLSANEASRVQETLKKTAYPMHFVSEDLTSVISSERNQVATFQIGEMNQAVFLLENTEVNKASDIINDLETRSYIDRVQLLRIEKQQADTDEFVFEFIVDLNKGILHEEASIQ